MRESEPKFILVLLVRLLALPCSTSLLPCGHSSPPFFIHER
ncbi:hypothetical protein HMPREF3038_00303 [Akkermansia sp. KLE1797]|nr:hypothetical protein HMPREF3038_00303 [Akkermansia sp. KLE1797]KXU54947.1 hypothetical protein HMPREF3039_00827 [Akkermansia sp. KLE1798]